MHPFAYFVSLSSYFLLSNIFRQAVIFVCFPVSKVSYGLYLLQPYFKLILTSRTIIIPQCFVSASLFGVPPRTFLLILNQYTQRERAALSLHLVCQQFVVRSPSCIPLSSSLLQFLLSTDPQLWMTSASNLRA